MSRGRDDHGHGGMGIAARFSLAMTAALAVVMAVTGTLLYSGTTKVAQQGQESGWLASTQLTAETIDDKKYDQVGETARKMGRVSVFDVRFTEGSHKGRDGYLYQYDGRDQLLVPKQSSDSTAGGLFGLIIAVTVTVVIVGAVVAYIVATRVSKPLTDIVEDVRKISKGNLTHRTRVRAGGEISLLAHAIDRMAGSLKESQDAQVDLAARERELEVAQEVRDALLPGETPSLAGYELGDMHLGCDEPEGDFHDYVQIGDKVCLLVCHVNGRGVPGALVGATARAYLRNELERGTDIETALKKVNRDLARDVRRGMFVTAMIVVIDPATHVATVACAGHKMPLIRYAAADKKVLKIQPEGIALAFDKGPIFDKSIATLAVQVEPGDRLVLANTGPAQVLSPEGDEFGENKFYRSVLRASQQPAEEMFDRLEDDLAGFADDEPFPADISILFLARDAWYADNRISEAD